MTYGELARKAASPTTKKVEVDLKSSAGFGIVGTPQNRIDAIDAVTGTKTYTTDLQVPDALPTMICRAPTLNGIPLAIENKAEVLALAGVTDAH